MTNALVDQVKEEVITAIKNDELVLPTLPEVALQIKEVAEDVASTIEDLAKIISRDTALTARLMKVANSPLIRATSEVADLNTAVSRLGIDLTTNLAMGLAMEQMFQATNDQIDNRMRACWQKSVDIAAISQVFAKKFSPLQSEQALLAGLTHQIGILPILSLAEENDGLMNDGIALDKVTRMLHPALGSYILKAWDFPNNLVAVPREYLKLEREGNEVDYADIVTLATIYYQKDTPKALPKAKWPKLTCWQRLDLTPEKFEESFEVLEDEINVALESLGAA